MKCTHIISLIIGSVISIRNAANLTPWTKSNFLAVVTIS